MKSTLSFLFFINIGFASFGQTYFIKGKILEAESGNPVPFANVTVVGKTIGTTSDFDGYYTLELREPYDSLMVSYIGFQPSKKFILRNKNQTINFFLEENVVNLQDVVVYAGENPAWPILRKIIDNRKDNDKRSLDAYEYEAYTKIEIDVNHITDKFKERKFMQKITSVVDSIEQLTGEDGRPILPVFISEAISKYYFRTSPKLTHENILKTKISGIGVSDGTTTSQLIGSSFQQHNFYLNWLKILDKDFASPIGSSWRINYEYYLTDSLYIGENFCYKIEFYPKSEQDLSFTGIMWVNKKDYALIQIDATVNKSANLNFVEKLKIQEEFEKTIAGPYLPVKTRVLVDIGELTQESAGILAKSYVSLKDIVVNDVKPTKFYETPIKMDEEVRDFNKDYWQSRRHDPLSSEEITIYSMVDTLKTIPVVKNGTMLIETLASGYFTVGKIDIGPYWMLFAKNDIEGLRNGMGFNTNYSFSKKWILAGNFNYGQKDQIAKYKASVDYIISRKPWVKVGFEHVKDLNPVWMLNDEGFNDNIFNTFARWGTLTKPFIQYENTLRLETRPLRGFKQSVRFKYQRFQPHETSSFSYYVDPDDPLAGTLSNFETTELDIETRFAKDEFVITDDNNQTTLEAIGWPVFTLNYHLGMKLFDSDFSYHKLQLTVEKRVKTGVLGYSNVRIDGGYIFSQLPYPLLKNHIGNQSPVYFNMAFSTMNYFEFVSDQFVEFRYDHHFGGLLINRLPLIKKMKVRAIANFNMIAGDVRNENKEAINPLEMDRENNLVLPFSYLDPSVPFMEVGYGLENIFRFFRVEAFHRLTYLQQGNPWDNIGIKFKFQVRL